MKKKLGLLPKLIIAIALGIVIGLIARKANLPIIIRIGATFNSIFGNFLGFCIPLIIIGFIALYLFLRRRIRDSRNTVLVRNKRANKVAIQRFRLAERYMQESNRRAFFEEMLRALWGYMGDKLNIPVSSLTKENIREELQRRGCPAQEAQLYTDIISRCDEAQYSPTDAIQMHDVYAEGIAIISRIEAIIKR